MFTWISRKLPNWGEIIYGRDRLRANVAIPWFGATVLCRRILPDLPIHWKCVGIDARCVDV